MLLAAAGDATILLELGAIVLALAVLAKVSNRIGVSPVPLYLLVGLVIGDDGPFSVGASRDFIEIGATIGVVLLLFTLGLEYSAEAFVTGLRANAPAGLVDLVANFTPGFVAGFLLGWEPIAAVVLGGVTYISSSGIIAKVLDDLGRTGNRETPVILSILVLEDLAMAFYLPLVGGLLAGGSTVETAAAIAGALVVAVLVMVVALRFGSRISRFIFDESPEVLLFSVLGLTLLVAGFAESLRVSAAVGAFLVGIAVSGPAAERAEPLMRPLRDLFAAAFFLFFALEVDLDAVPGALPAAVVLAIVTAATKVATGWWSARRAGVGVRGRRRAGATLIARGEFSIVIASLAITSGVIADLGALAATYVLILALLGPVAARMAGSRRDPASASP